MNETYTTEQLDYLFNNRKLMTGNELTSAFNAQFFAHKKPGTIKRLCNKRQWFANSNGRFTKGQKPWNAGTKGFTAANKTSFKCGHQHLYNPPKPIGFERKRDKDGYIFVKTAHPNRWALKHVFIYEQNHGPLQKGFIVRFKDGNNTNFDPDNLEAIDRKLNLQLNRNGYRQADPQIKPLIKMISKIEVGLFEQRTGANNG